MAILKIPLTNRKFRFSQVDISHDICISKCTSASNTQWQDVGVKMTLTVAPAGPKESNSQRASQPQRQDGWHSGPHATPDDKGERGITLC
jgi:hypothetical protein